MRPISTSNRIYRDFRGIEGGAYRAIIRFYETKARQIQQLEFDAYFEILVDYTNALFEIGAYRKHLAAVDVILVLSIEHNIQFYKGEDIYCKSLFQKAASHYNLLEFDKAEYILKELIKINPNNQITTHFLRKCLYHTRPKYIQYARAISIFLFLGAALVAAIEVMLVYPFVPLYVDNFEVFRISLFCLGIFILVGSFLFHLFQINRKVTRFIKSIR